MSANRVIDKHSQLTELDFASAGHTGYASSADLTTVSGLTDTNASDISDNTTLIATTSGSLNTKIDDKADKGINADITSMTGLDNDGIPAAKIAGAIETAILASSVITDNRLIRGDGGSRGAQETTITVSDDGEMVNTSQPAFCTHPTASQENLSINSWVEIIFGTERFDQGNNFASNTFTAPVTGNYQLNISLRLLEVDIAADNYWIKLNTSNKIYYYIFDCHFTADPTSRVAAFSVLADMDLNDTVNVSFYQSAGTAQVDISAYSFFSGHLVC